MARAEARVVAGPNCVRRPAIMAVRGWIMGKRDDAHDGEVATRRWTPGRRKRFFDGLAQTADVAGSARAAGMSAERACHARRTNAAFATAWRDALAIGYERLETALLGHALTGVDALEVAAADGSDASPRVMAPDQVKVAMAILNRHDAAQRRGPELPRERPAATLAEAEAALTKRLDAVARRRPVIDGDPA